MQTSPKPVRDWNVSPAADDAAPPRPVQEDVRSGALRSLARAMWILAACATVAALRIGRDLLIPLVLGVLLALVLSGIVETLRRWRVPRSLSALVLLLLIAVGIGGVLDAIWTPAQQWIENAPRVLRTVERRLRPAQSIVQRLDAIADRVSNIASPGGKEAAPPSATAAPSVTAASVLAGTGWFAASIVMWLALTLLLLAAGPGTLARMTATLAADWHPANVLRIIHAIRNEVGRYYATLAVINVGFGAVTALVMWLLGMPNPVLWGAIAGVLNFIPYLGCITTLVILSVVALVTFDHITHTLLVGASFLTPRGDRGARGGAGLHRPPARSQSNHGSGRDLDGRLDLGHHGRGSGIAHAGCSQGRGVTQRARRRAGTFPQPQPPTGAALGGTNRPARCGVAPSVPVRTQRLTPSALASISIALRWP